MPKPPSKLLTSIENVRIHRDIEIVTETYFVALGYDLQGKASNDVTELDETLSVLMPQDKGLSRFFHLVTTPIFKIRKRQTHQFLGGLPIYYGAPGPVSSLYLAVLESDKGAREAGATLGKVMKEIPTDGLFEILGTLAATAVPQVELIKQGFSLLVKVVEAALLGSKDRLRYTNVLTFKESNDWLVGTHENVGNDRVSITLSVERE